MEAGILGFRLGHDRFTSGYLCGASMANI